MVGYSIVALVYYSILVLQYCSIEVLQYCSFVFCRTSIFYDIIVCGHAVLIIIVIIILALDCGQCC